MLFTGLYFQSCCDECPVGPCDPQPYKGYLYVLDCWSGWLYHIDLETDSVIDSLRPEVDRFSTGAFDVANDGRYLAVNFTHTNPSTSSIRIFDAQTLQLMAEIPDGGYPVFTENTQKLIPN